MGENLIELFSRREKVPEGRMRDLTGVSLAKMNQNSVENAFEVSEHIGVPDSEHPETFALQIGRSLLVIPNFMPFAMRGTIDLDDQHVTETSEVRNVGWDGHLASKLEATESAITQVSPKPLLGFGLIGAKTPGPGNCLGRLIHRRSLRQIEPQVKTRIRHVPCHLPPTGEGPSTHALLPQEKVPEGRMRVAPEE